MSSFYVMAKRNEQATPAAKRDIARWCSFKQIQTAATLESDWASVALISPAGGHDATIARTPAGDWLCWAGTWIHKGGIPSHDTQALFDRYIAVGAEKLASELEGVFSIAIGINHLKTVTILTDPIGSLHVYVRADSRGTAICTSSVALSETGILDPVGVHEFIACGIIYEDRSLWAGITKLPPASIVHFSGPKRDRAVYWRIDDALPPRLKINEAGDGLMDNLVTSLRVIGKNFNPVVADLTGGYDSRLLLCGLLESGINFHNTVAGAPDSADVLTAKTIAQELGTTLRYFEDDGEMALASFHQSIRLSDGEYNAFDYARILASQAPLARQYKASLNGSFGEVGRGYWWELLWPNLTRIRPLDANLVAHKRFAAVPYSNIFKDPPFESFVEHIAGVVSRTAAPYKDFPVASQMDCIYLPMRMQRWQGRIASNTNQLWPSISPIGFTTVLTPILSARPGVRLRSLLPRKIFATRNSALATIPLEHGYPPVPVTLLNLPSFFPIGGHYAGKLKNKIQARIRAKTPPTAAPITLQARYRVLFDESLASVLATPQIIASEIFDEEKTRDMLTTDQCLSGHRLEQWQRMVSIEYTLRAREDAAQAAQLLG